MAKLIAANYNSTTSSAYGFMSVNIPAGVIKKNTVYTLVARYKWTKGSVDDHPMVAYLYDSGWTGIAGYYNITYTNDTYAVQTRVFTIPDKDEIATTSFKIHNYACTSSNTDKGAVLSVDWYELWEGDVTQFSLTDAIGLSGAGVNLYSGLGGNDYSNLLTSGSGFTNHGIDITTFGFPCQKFTTSTDTGYCYKSESGIGSGYYNLSYDLYSTVEVTDLGSYANGQGHILLSQTTYVPANTWTRVYCTYQATNSNMIALCSPKKVGTYYIKDLKITRCDLECPINYTDASATSNTLPNNFNSIISNVRNSNYFNNTNTNGINSVRNWRGYYYNTNTFIASTSLSTTSVAASGGTITVNYTVKENWTNGKTPTPKAGVTPTITSSIGTVSNITATDANGNGTAKITVASRGTTVGAAQTGTVSVSFGGITRTATFTQALNKITSVRIAGSIPSGGAYTNPPSLNDQAPASGKTWSPFTIYPTFSSGATTGNYGGSAITQSNWSISGEGFSVASANGWWAVKVTAANRGTTIGDARNGTLTVTIPDGVGGTVSGSTSLGQAANAKTSIIYGDPVISSFSYANKNAATGTVNPSISYYQTRVQQYTSGSEETLSDLTSGGTISYSETTASSYASVNATTGVVSWNANRATANRSVGITATVTMNGKSGSKATTSTQLGDIVESTTYGNVTKGTITNATIPASGTTTNYTATAGNGSQVITKSWVSGDITTETNTVAPSVASISATASSKGTTVSGKTTVKSQAVTWTGSGGKKASDTMYIYQEANTITAIKAVLKDKNVSSAHFTYGAYNSGRAIPATGVNNLAVVDNGAAILTFTSGDDSDELTAGNHYGGTLSFSRIFYFNGDPNTLSSDGFTINKTTGALTVTNNESTSAKTIYAYGDLTATWGSLSHAITHQRNLKQNAGKIEYGDITITGGYGSTIARTGGSLTPAISYSQSYTWNGVAGSGGTETTGATIAYSKSSTNDGFTLDSTSTGKVTAITNDGSIDPITGLTQLHYWPTATRSTNINVNVAKNGKSANKTLVVSQAGNGIKTISFSAGAGLGGQLGAVSSFTSAAGSKTVSSTTPANVTDKLTAILATYTLEAKPNGLKTATFTNVPILDYINYSGPTYSWSSNSSWATVSGTAATSTVKVTANTGALRTATITRNGSFAVTLKPEYKASSFIGSDSATVTGTATTTVSQAAGVTKQERTMFYRNPPTSLYIAGIQGGFVFQTGANTSFSSSTYTLPSLPSTTQQSMGITLTETDSTKASSFYIYMNNISVGVNSSMQPSVRMHLKVGVKSSETLFSETWYDQYITPTSIVNQNGMWIATWDSSKYALINIPASGSGSLCHIDVEFTY